MPSVPDPAPTPPPADAPTLGEVMERVLDHGLMVEPHARAALAALDLAGGEGRVRVVGSEVATPEGAAAESAMPDAMPEARPARPEGTTERVPLRTWMDRLERLEQHGAPAAPDTSGAADRRGARSAGGTRGRGRDLLVTLVDALPDPVVLFAPGPHDAAGVPGVVLAQNRRAARLLDPLTTDDAGRRRAMERNVLLFAAYLGGRQDDAGPTEIALVDPDDGSDLLFEVCESSLDPGDNGPTGARLLALRDVTALRQFSAELETRVREATADLARQNALLQAQSQELERANRLKSEFLASMSHELRTPINALIGYSALLLDRVYGELTPKQSTSLERMRASAQQLLALINDILDLARIEAGRMPVHLERATVAQAVGEAALAARAAAEAKGLAFVLELPDDLPAVRTDPSKLGQVLANLLSNAVKFTLEGRVTLRATRDGTRVRLDVVDTGIGIPAPELETIWEDFRQLDQSRTREFGGTGLGLSIVHKLAERLEAQLAVRSTPGEGTTFSVWVPVEE